MRLVIGNIVASYERIKIIYDSMPLKADVLRRLAEVVTRAIFFLCWWSDFRVFLASGYRLTSGSK